MSEAKGYWDLQGNQAERDSEVQTRNKSSDSRPATYQFPPGTPEEVPADFEEAKVERETGGLTAEEITEFRELREERKRRDAEAAEEAELAASKRQPNRHHVHLADGSVVDGSSIETHVDNGDGPVPVVGAYPMAEFVTFAPVGG